MVDVLVGRDDTVNPKLNPEPLIKAIKSLNLKANEVVMVDDSIDNAKCAYNAEVHFIWIMSKLSVRMPLETSTM